MDVNGLPMWELAGRADFGLAPSAKPPFIADRLHFKDALGHVLLSEKQPAPALTEVETWSRAQASAPSPVADQRGGFAWWDGASKTVQASGFAPGTIQLFPPHLDPPYDEPASMIGASDLALGDDDVLYIARDGALTWRDLRDRWRPARIARDDFRADLIAPMAGGGVWVFDKLHRRLGRARGYPLQFAGLRDADPTRFDPVEPNRNPPRLIRARAAPLGSAYEVVAMAASVGGKLALLAWEPGEDASILTLEGNAFARRFRLEGLRYPYSLAWVGEDRVAVLAGDNSRPARQAFLYPIEGAPTPDVVTTPSGQIHPLINPSEAKFANGLAPVPRYLADPEAGVATVERPLRALSGTKFARSGSVMIGPIDAGRPGCVWHRLYADAAVPDGGAITVNALATESRTPPKLPGEAQAPGWAPHRIAPARTEGIPNASWVSQRSEVPFAESALGCIPRPNRAGLWTVLLQQTGRKVRRVTGRYLWLHVTLEGDSQATPELAALRVYANRLSWRDQYLPAFYREPLSGPDAAAAGPATPNDFLERMLHLYEGVLTETEGRIAGSWLLTDPTAAPASALPWIGRWIGVAIDPADSAERSRQALLAAPYTAALNGTLGGLLAALELGTGGRLYQGARIDPDDRAPAPGALAVATVGDTATRALALGMARGGSCTMLTGGAVTRGSIVVVEGFRLRRTFATILGTDLNDEEDPLTLGLIQSGNSFVGDTLILGDVARQELLSLFRPEIDRARSGDTQAVQQFYARLAHRVLVLVRGVKDRNEMARLKDVIEAAVPAHVEASMHQARRPLIVGAASLVGIDSWLDQPEPFEVVRLGRSIVGEGDFVAGSGGLDQRADGPVSIRPTARISGPSVVSAGQRFVLSAIGSKGAPGSNITSHIWTWDD